MNKAVFSVLLIFTAVLYCAPASAVISGDLSPSGKSSYSCHQIDCSEVAFVVSPNDYGTGCTAICYEEKLPAAAGVEQLIGQFVYYNCTTCANGYTKQTVDTCPNAADNNHISPTVNACVKTCDADCATTDWANYSNSSYPLLVKRRVYSATCHAGTCTKRYRFGCKSGYYGNITTTTPAPTATTTTCSQCPIAQGQTVLSDPENNSSQTSCYVTGGSDRTGSFVYKNTNGEDTTCHYSNFDPVIPSL